MNRLLLIICGASWLFSAIEPLNANALVEVPKGDFTCTVMVAYHEGAPVPDSASSASAPPANSRAAVMTAATIVRSGRLQLDTFTWSDGTTSQAWTLLDSGMTLLKKNTPMDKSIYDLNRGSSERQVLCPTILDLDAASLAWIDLSNSTGKATHEGRPALHYKKAAYLYNFIPPRVTSHQAWIDPKTLVPIAFDDGMYLYDLTFSGPPAEPLALPDEFKKELKDYLNANATPRHL